VCLFVEDQPENGRRVVLHYRNQDHCFVYDFNVESAQAISPHKIELRIQHEVSLL